MNKTEKSRPSWDEYGMMLAYTASTRSPDPYVNVGAVAFREDRSTVSTGYNGAASGVEIDWSNRDARRPFVVHAERNCLKYAKEGEPYYLYVTLSPCLECLGVAKTYGVKEIIYSQVYERDASALTKAEEYGISIRQLSLTNEHFKTKPSLI
jgi:dCMP deaminase